MGEHCTESLATRCYRGVFDREHNFCQCDPLWAGEVGGTVAGCAAAHEMGFPRGACSPVSCGSQQPPTVTANRCAPLPLIIPPRTCCRRAIFSHACTGLWYKVDWTLTGPRCSSASAWRTGRGPSTLPSCQPAGHLVRHGPSIQQPLGWAAPTPIPAHTPLGVLWQLQRTPTPSSHSLNVLQSERPPPPFRSLVDTHLLFCVLCQLQHPLSRRMQLSGHDMRASPGRFRPQLCVRWARERQVGGHPGLLCL